MSEKAKSVLFMFLFSYLIWGGLSYTFLMTAIENYISKIEFREKILRGECTLIDQYGNCYSAKQYQDILENNKKEATKGFYGL